MAKKKDTTKKGETINPADRPDARLIYSGDTPKHKAPAGVLLRLPRSLHRKLKAQAYEEGVPMSQHILRCLAEASKSVEMGHQIGVITVDEDTGFPVPDAPVKGIEVALTPVTKAPEKAKKERKKKEKAKEPEAPTAGPVTAAVAIEDDGFTVEVEIAPEVDPAAEF